MILNEEEKKKFEKVVRPVMKYLGQNKFHPHMKIIIDYGRAEFVEGKVSFVTEDYVLD